MILVFDLSNVGIVHAPFDHGYLRVLRHAFPGEPIRFFGEATHCELLAAMEGHGSPVQFERGPFLGKIGRARHRPWEVLPRAWRAVRAMRGIAETVRPRFVAVVSEVLPAIRFAVRHLWRWQGAPPLDLVLHSDIATLEGWRSRNPLLRAFDWEAELRRPVRGPVRLVTLEAGIRDHLVARFPERAAETVTLDHPVPESECDDDRREPSDPLEIGFIGNSAPEKGFGAFLDLARAVPGPRYHAIGQALGTLPADAATILATPPGPRLPRAEFLRRLRALDLVVLPLTRPAYDWTASGTLIDCLTNLVPVLTTRTAVTEGVFSRHGPIGVMVETERDLAPTLRGIDAAWLAANRPAFLANLRAARAARLPAALARTYPGRIGPAAPAG